MNWETKVWLCCVGLFGFFNQFLFVHFHWDERCRKIDDAYAALGVSQQKCLKCSSEKSPRCQGHWVLGYKQLAQCIFTRIPDGPILKWQWICSVAPIALPEFSQLVSSMDWISLKKIFFKIFWVYIVTSMEKAMAPHSSTLAWKIPWTEEPGRLSTMGSRRVGHDWATSLSLFPFMHWRRKWKPTPVFLPGESQGQGSLVGCCLWGHTESDMTEAT